MYIYIYISFRNHLYVLYHPRSSDHAVKKSSKPSRFLRQTASHRTPRIATPRGKTSEKAGQRTRRPDLFQLVKLSYCFKGSCFRVVGSFFVDVLSCFHVSEPEDVHFFRIVVPCSQQEWLVWAG